MLTTQSNLTRKLPIYTLSLVTILLLFARYAPARAELGETPTLNPSIATPTSEISPWSPSPTVETTPTPTSTASPTPTPTATINPPENTATLTATVTVTPWATETAVITTTISNLAHDLAAQAIYLPAILRHIDPIPYEDPLPVYYCRSFGSPRPIPDNDPQGLVDSFQISDTRLIADLDVYLKIDHTWVGDLNASLMHQESGLSIPLFDRPGVPATTTGCGYNDIRAILTDEISLPVEKRCDEYPAGIAGIYQPDQRLDTFDGLSIAGTWNLQIIDNHKSDLGELLAWCLVPQLSPNPPPPTPTPEIPPVPAAVSNLKISGQNQALNLDCESRSAVDWAAFFGKRIGELEFFNNLPKHDNPDKGFVGNVNGTWGQIPPNPYGVHAAPVAALLRNYGLEAYAHRPFRYEALQAEIAAGHPVITWIIGSILVNKSLMLGVPEYFTASDGETTVVARYEHTVVVVGYTQDRVYYLNGDSIHYVGVTRFLESWSALGNMAIAATP